MPPSFYYDPSWSPDGKKIAYTDKRLNLWYVDVEHGQVDEGRHDPYDDDPPAAGRRGRPTATGSPTPSSSRATCSAVFLYSLETARRTQVTDGMSDARFVGFDKGGKYLYFTASTDVGPAGRLGHVEPQPAGHAERLRRRAEQGRPVAARARERRGEGRRRTATRTRRRTRTRTRRTTRSRRKVKIDLEDIDQRILALPMPAANYAGLIAGKAGTIFLRRRPAGGAGRRRADGRRRRPSTVSTWQAQGREAVRRGVSARRRLGQRREDALPARRRLVPRRRPAAPPKPGDGALKLDGMEVRVDPRAEWRQMYREVWRIERDFLYDPTSTA